MRRLPCALALGLVFGSTPARADLVHLMSGTSQECVIHNVTDEWVTYETALGRASLPRYKVVGITREPPETNEKLLQGWRAERAGTAARARARQRSTRVDRLTKQAMGLVEYDGEWIPREERAAREQAKQAAKLAAAQLNREEAAAGHYFHYRVWMTQATYRAVLQLETELRTYHNRLVDLQQEIALLSDEIDTARLMALRDGDMDAMEQRAKDVEQKRAAQDAAAAEIREVQRKGDAAAGEIDTLVARSRERLRQVLEARGASAAALEYLAESS